MFLLIMFFYNNIIHYDIYIPLLCIIYIFVEINLSVGISLSNCIFSVSFSAVFELFCGEVFVSFVILSESLLPIKSPVNSANF